MTAEQFYTQEAIDGRAVILGTQEEPRLWLYRCDGRLLVVDDYEPLLMPGYLEAAQGTIDDIQAAWYAHLATAMLPRKPRKTYTMRTVH